MRKLILAAAAAVSILAAGCTPAFARSSQPIADWSAVEQDDGDFVSCPSQIISADRAFPHACLVGVLVREGGYAGRKFNVLGFYNAYGIPRANPDRRIEALPRLYNKTPAPELKTIIDTRGWIPGVTMIALLDGSQARYRQVNASSGQIVAEVRDNRSPSGWAPHFWDPETGRASWGRAPAIDLSKVTMHQVKR